MEFFENLIFQQTRNYQHVFEVSQVQPSQDE